MPVLIKLISSDNEEFSVDFKVAKMSGTISGLMEALQMDDTTDEATIANSPIPLPKVKAAQLKRIIEWCEYYKKDVTRQHDDVKGITSTVLRPCVEKMLKTDNNDEFGELCQLMVAANYLDVKGLYNDISQTIANMIHGLKADEMAAKFHVKCDLTDYQVKEIRKSNAWCEE